MHRSNCKGSFQIILIFSSEYDDLAKIRNSHNKLREKFPISSRLWQRLIFTELAQDNLDVEAMAQIDAVFKLALDDYYSKCQAKLHELRGGGSMPEHYLNCHCLSTDMEIAVQYSEFALSFGGECEWHNIISSYGFDVLLGSEIMKNRRSYLRSVDGM